MVCSRCDVEKPIDEFPFRSKVMGTRHKRCKPCMVETTRPYNHTEAKRAHGRAYHLANAGERNAQRRMWNEDHPFERQAYQRAYTLARRYGMTVTEYEALLRAQDGRCAICGLEPTDRNLHVDHCHKTGEVRGLLCTLCNLGIGMLADDAERLRAAADYLEQTNRRSPVVLEAAMAFSQTDPALQAN